MITANIWKEIIGFPYSSTSDYAIGIIMTLFAIPLDVILCPIEIIAFIICKIVERSK